MFDEAIQENNFQEISRIQTALHENSLQSLRISNCIDPKIPHCTDFLDTWTCTDCEDGFYVNSDRTGCVKAPITPIPNCSNYNPDGDCFSCSTGFFFNGASCVLNTEIPKCVLFNAQEATKTTCLRCDPEYYVSNNKCELRDNPIIENCDELAVDKDECLLCGSNLLLTNDKLSCKTPIPQCKEYLTSQKDFNLVCKACEDYFYLDENTKCSSGGLENCRIYENKDICEECDFGYLYKKEFNTCESREATIKNCDRFEILIDNQCLECSSNDFKVDFNLSKYCRFNEDISNCEEYQDYDTCGKCEDYYFISDCEGKSCCEEIEDENCKQQTDGICTLCN